MQYNPLQTLDELEIMCNNIIELIELNRDDLRHAMDGDLFDAYKRLTEKELQNLESVKKKLYELSSYTV